MFANIRQIFASCLVLGVIILTNANLAHARRLPTDVSKSFTSGKISDGLEKGLAGKPRRPMAVRVRKPLHVSLPHAMKKPQKIAMQVRR